MSADEFCAAMNDDVDAVINRPEQDGCSDSVIADYRHTIFVGDFSYLFVLQNVVFGIADTLYVNETGVVLDCLCKIVRVLRVNEGYFDAEFLKCLAEQRNGSAVEGVRRNDMASCTANIKDADVYC